MSDRPAVLQLSQHRIVIAAAVLLLVGFSIFLPGFLGVANLLSLLQSVSVIGTLGVAMALVVLGRNMDLSLIATMTMPVAWFVVSVQSGSPVLYAALLAVGLALLIGLVNGWLVAYAQVPGIIVTIGTGTFFYGAVQYFFVPMDVIPLSERLEPLSSIASYRIGGVVPVAIVFFAVVAGLSAAFLTFTRPGRFIYAIGDNPEAARLAGVEVRPMIVLQYLAAALIAVAAGALLTGVVHSANTRLFNSNMIYDVVLVVVLGGIGLSGGRGGIGYVVAGTVLIGIIINAMTLMDMSLVEQNLVKALILLAVFILDSFLNPRDEQLSQRGDI